MKVLFLLNLVLLFGVNCRVLGHHPSRRIVNRIEAKPGDFKFQVAIMTKNQLRCSGSIIAADAIITTASCLTMNYGPFTILAGTHNLKGAGHIFEVKKIINHPKWKEGDDLSIIQTKESMTKLNDSNIEGIQMNFKPFTEKSMVNISGWGATSFTSRNSQILLYGSVKLLHWNECVHLLPIDWHKYHESFCTNAVKTTDSLCWQDQGGPVVYNKTLIGVSVVSFLCNNPNIHLAIRPHAEWINNVIRNLE